MAKMGARRGGGRAIPAAAGFLGAPLKKHHQMKPGAPPGGSTWNLEELRLSLNLETRRTAAVDEAPYRRGHANAAFGTVADKIIKQNII